MKLSSFRNSEENLKYTCNKTKDEILEIIAEEFKDAMRSFQNRCVF